MEVNIDESLKGESILLCNIYRPPGTPVSFWHRLNVTIEKALGASKRIIIVGDLNEDQLNVQNYHVYNLVNTIEVSVRVSTTSTTLLGLIIVPDSEKKKKKKKKKKKQNKKNLTQMLLKLAKQLLATLQYTS